MALSQYVNAAPPEASKQASQMNGAGFYHRPLGDYDVWTVTDGFGFWPAYPTFGGRTAEKSAVEKAARKWHLDPAQLYNTFLMMVVRTDNDLILIDTGYGDSQRQPTAGHLVEHLELLGFQPEDFTQVILTHAHPDHLWGAVKNGKPLYRNAQHYISQTEMEFWNRDDREIQQAPEQMRGMLTTTRDTLRALEPKLKLVQDGDTVQGLKMISLPGHTPGHMGVRIQSGGETLYHVADIANHCRLLFDHPEWDFSYDNDVQQAVQTRRKMLSRAASEDALIFGSHYTYPGFGHVNEMGDGFHFIPEPIQFGWDQSQGHAH
ncbi:MAG: beta-lactamase domain-containing protein [Puniceicoccaceae bacterium 5H]|nr:MAG: beta-lactamase domain-containing protein [Puniceicoccaceae bacterium 5H]